MNPLKTNTMRMIAVSIVAVIATSAPAATTSPGKSSVSASGFGVTLPDGVTGEAVLVSGTILKGKAKQVVVIEGALATYFQSIFPFLRAKVNGVVAEGAVVAADCKNTSSTRCSVAGVWWLDLDAAETANPGVFIGQPLTIELFGGTDTFAPPISGTGDVSMSARLQKK